MGIILISHLGFAFFSNIETFDFQQLMDIARYIMTLLFQYDQQKRFGTHVFHQQFLFSGWLPH